MTATLLPLNLLKTCTGCRRHLPISEFGNNKALPSGKQPKCRKCHAEKIKAHYYSNPDSKRRIIAYSKQWALDNPDKRVVYNRKSLLKKYGITTEQYDILLQVQDGKCAICLVDNNGNSTQKFFAVDHDHKTGRVRGLLCHPCNLAIGLLKDNRETMRKAIAYLERNT